VTPWVSTRQVGSPRARSNLVRLLVAVGLGAASAGLAGAAGRGEVEVSKLPGAQNEPAIAIDPSNDRILLAGSNSFREGSMRVYSSLDGGSTWTRSFPYRRPASFLSTCASDPGVAVDLTGRQYYSFIRTTPCRTGHPRLFVASRSGSKAAWGSPVLVSPLRTSAADDKPAIAVDASPSSPYRNRVYAAWSRLSHNQVLNIVLSHSDDDGRSWSPIVKVNRTGDQETYASVAVSRNGTVYVTWDDTSGYRLAIARSTDGGAHFEPERQAEAFSIVPIPSCGSGILIPASLRVCIHANPIVSVDRSLGPRSGRVYLSYTKTGSGGDEGVFVKAFDRSLRPLLGGPNDEGVAVAPAPRRTRPDQFWPASAVDSSSGALWVCFYDTTGDPARERVFYACTVSRNGGRTWAPRVRAASVPSDETQPGADLRQYGDYEGLAVANGVAHPIWTDSRDLRTFAEEIYTTRLAEAGMPASARR
jgi:hypothetical protein